MHNAGVGVAERATGYPSPVTIAVFLDRDNTLIANDGDLGEPDGVRLIDGVAEGLKALREAGYRLVVVTNQGGVARGVFTEDDVDSVHQRIATLVDDAAGAQELVSRFYYCPYHPEAKIDAYRLDHPWRKPRPGMLLQAARDLNLDLAHSWMIGDAARDVEAGRSAGCRTVLVSSEPRVIERAKPTAAVGTFREAVATILRERPVSNGTGAGTNRPVLAAASPAPGPDAPRSEAAPGAATRRTGGDGPDAVADLKRAVNELTEEIRTDRMRRSEFTSLRLTAGMCLLLALLLALLGVLQLDAVEVFVKWMSGAGLVLLLAIAVLLLDLKG